MHFFTSSQCFWMALTLQIWNIVNVNKQLKKGSTRVFFYFDKTTEQVHVAIIQLQYCWYINFKKFNNIYPITTAVMSSNLDQGKVYNIIIARNHGWFCSWIFINQIASCMTAAGLWSSPGTSVSSTNKIYHHDIVEILLKVVLKIPQP
jgi:hypothetical protein